MRVLLLAAIVLCVSAGCLDGGESGGERALGEWSKGRDVHVRIDRVTAVPANATMAAAGGAFELTIELSVRWHNGSREVSGFEVDAGGFGELARDWQPPMLAEAGQGQVTSHVHWSIPRHLPNAPLAITVTAAVCGTAVQGGWQGSETVPDCHREAARFRVEPTLAATA